MQVLGYIRKYKKIIIALICALVLVLVAKNVFENYALANIQVTTAGNQPAGNVKIHVSSDDTYAEIGDAGWKIIPRTTKSLVATKGESASTQVEIKIPWYGYLEKTISLTPSKNAEKIAYLNTNRRACATYSIRLTSLLAYDCTKPTSLSQYDTSAKTWTPKRLGTLPFKDGLVAPYMGGVIGIESGQHVVNRPVLAVRDDDTRIRFDLPLQMSTESIARSKIFTNTFTTSDPRFVIVDDNGNIHLGVPSSQNKSIAYKTIPSPAGYSSSHQQTLCQITGDFVYCYRGQAPRGDIPPSSVKLPAESIVTASFVNDTISDVPLENPGRYSGFYVTLDGDMYGKNYKKIFYLSQSGNSYKAKELAQNVDTATGGEGLLYVQSNAVYRVKKGNDATMLFYSRNVLPKSLYVSEGSTYVIGNVKNLGDDFHAYKLNDQDYTGQNRLIDQLPAGRGQLPAVTSQNLVGNRAQFTLAIPITKTAREDIDRTDFEAKKQKVLDALSSRDIDLTQLDVTFNY